MWLVEFDLQSCICRCECLYYKWILYFILKIWSIIDSLSSLFVFLLFIKSMCVFNLTQALFTSYFQTFHAFHVSFFLDCVCSILIILPGLKNLEQVISGRWDFLVILWWINIKSMTHIQPIWRCCHWSLWSDDVFMAVSLPLKHSDSGSMFVPPERSAGRCWRGTSGWWSWASLLQPSSSPGHVSASQPPTQETCSTG